MNSKIPDVDVDKITKGAGKVFDGIVSGVKDLVEGVPVGDLSHDQKSILEQVDKVTASMKETDRELAILKKLVMTNLKDKAAGSKAKKAEAPAKKKSDDKKEADEDKTDDK